MSRPGRSYRHNPSERERGFSIIEVVVALALISVGLLGTIEMMSRIGQTRSTSYRQVAATDLAASELATMKAVPSDELGFMAGANGLKSVFEGRTTVMVVTSPLRPSGPDVAGRDVTFTVERSVTWEPIAAVNEPQGFKHLTVEIRWSDSLGPHHVRVDSARYALLPGPS
ncbi:MAG: prepilin-type N-terminal cleavage/methylation domain-containing protein [Acidimicrobiales bacterium]